MVVSWLTPGRKLDSKKVWGVPANLGTRALGGRFLTLISILPPSTSSLDTAQEVFLESVSYRKCSNEQVW